MTPWHQDCAFLSVPSPTPSSTTLVTSTPWLCPPSSAPSRRSWGCKGHPEMRESRLSTSSFPAPSAVTPSVRYTMAVTTPSRACQTGTALTTVLSLACMSPSARMFSVSSTLAAVKVSAHHAPCARPADQDVAGPSFHPEGEKPSSPCQACINEGDGDSPQRLYSIRGFNRGDFDVEIPRIWFVAPPKTITGFDTETAAVRVSNWLL